MAEAGLLLPVVAVQVRLEEAVEQQIQDAAVEHEKSVEEEAQLAAEAARQKQDEEAGEMAGLAVRVFQIPLCFWMAVQVYSALGSKEVLRLADRSWT